MTIKIRFERFTRRIKPTEEHFKQANRQTKHMIDELHDKVAEDGSFTLEKVLRAGSNAKHTSLRKTDDNRFDVDLGAYYSGEGATKEHLGRLLEFTRDCLIDIYHQKDEDDFKILESAVRVEFVSGIKLWVDVAPIIKDNSLHIENAGWIPRKDKWRLTSVTAHNDFVSRRNIQSKGVSGPVHFNRLVRMMKWWNNLQGDLVQRSIFCELITAAAFAETGVTTDRLARPHPGPLAQDRVAGLGPVPQTFTHRMISMEPISMKYGQVRILDSAKFPVTTTTAALVEVEPGGMRELHWHPNADEWQYHLSGRSRMTVFASGGAAQTFDYQAGDVGYIPRAMPHYVENMGTTTMRLLEMFRSPKFEDVPLAQWLAFTSHELVRAHLNIDESVLAKIPPRKTPVGGA